MDGMNVNTMLKRLEAAASRLEDVVMFAEMRRATAGDDAAAPAAPAVPETSRDSFTESPQDLLLTTSSSHAISPKSSTPLVVVNAPPLPEISKIHEDEGYLAIKAIRQSKVAEFVKLSGSVAPGVEKQAQAFDDAFKEMLEVVALARTSKKPTMDEFMKLLQPMNEAATKVETLRDEYRKERDLTNFFATVPAGVGALGWVTIEGKNEAASFITEMRDSAQFYGNRVLKDRKDEKPWVDTYIGILTDLAAAVKKHFPEGLQWNANGISLLARSSISASADSPASSATSPASSTASPASSTAGGPPPPPPPPSVEQLTADKSPSSAASGSESASGGMGGVFAELNKGEAIASGLKKVDRAALKASKPPIPKSTKPKAKSASSSSETPASAASAGANAKKLQPRVELVESKWHVEDLNDRHDVEIEASMGQSVQIDNCNNCTIKISGKAATFNLSRCSKIGLLVETMVASCDIVNCANFGLQVTGTLPSLMIDQSSQGSIYLSKDSLGVDIFTSQTTAINVNVPEDEPGAYREIPLGEQIVHSLVDGKFKSTVVKHS